MPGFTADGGFADYMVTSERGAVRLKGLKGEHRLFEVEWRE